MNPLTNMKNVLKLSEQELDNPNKTSWHDQYRDSAWLFVGGLPYELTEGDVICVFSQFGEIVHLNLVRDKDTGKSRGFGFICFEDQRSTDLTVDNLNGVKIMGRVVRVDHVSNYKVPKSEIDKVKQIQQLSATTNEDEDSKLPVKKMKTEIQIEVKLEIKAEPVDARETLADQIAGDVTLPYRLPLYPVKQEPIDNEQDEQSKQEPKKKRKKEKKAKKHKREKKAKKDKKERKKKSRHYSSNSD